MAVNYYKENEQSENWPELLDTPMQRWSRRDYVEGFERAGFAAIEQRFACGARLWKTRPTATRLHCLRLE